MDKDELELLLDTALAVMLLAERLGSHQDIVVALTRGIDAVRQKSKK